VIEFLLSVFQMKVGTAKVGLCRPVLFDKVIAVFAEGV
jgi:hypothetical protein